MLIKINLSLYPLEAILNTSYFFTDKCYIYLDTDAQNRFVKVFIKPKSRVSKKALQNIINDFKNELLFASLRVLVSQKNKKIREYIVGRALYSSLPVVDRTPGKENGNYLDDPLGIAIPWEEKYGSRKKSKSR